MVTSLSDFVDSLRREVSPLGTNEFAGINDDTMTAYLADAFWEARLDGLINGWAADEDGEIPDQAGKEFPREYVALLVLYAGIKILRLRILNAGTGASFRAKAGPVEFEENSSANVLAELLKQLQELKNHLLDDEHEATVSYLIDGYAVRQWCPSSYWGDHLSGVFGGV